MSSYVLIAFYSLSSYSFEYNLVVTEKVGKEEKLIPLIVNPNSKNEYTAYLCPTPDMVYLGNGFCQEVTKTVTQHSFNSYLKFQPGGFNLVVVPQYQCAASVEETFKVIVEKEIDTGLTYEKKMHENSRIQCRTPGLTYYEVLPTNKLAHEILNFRKEAHKILKFHIKKLPHSAEANIEFIRSR